MFLAINYARAVYVRVISETSLPIQQVFFTCTKLEIILFSFHCRAIRRQRTADTVKFSRWISNGNRTSCRPIRSVIIRVITNSDDRAAEVRFVNHEYDYRPNWTTRSLITN